MPMPLPADRYIKVGNINTRFWASGDQGPPVILVHGLGGSIENWVYNIEPLAQRHRVYALDLKGFGRTDQTPLLREMEELMQFVIDFMEVQEIPKASLLGNSLGGGIVLSIAIRSPEKVDKLVLVDSAGMGRDVIIDFRLVSIPILGELLSRTSRKSVASLWRKIVYDPALVTDELIEETFKLATLPGAHKALLTTLRAGIGIRGQRADQRRRITENISKLKAPTLIFWGREDRIIPVAHAHIAAKMIPGAKLHIFDKCGHVPMMERPDEFNKLVLEFLAG
jgi:pimeloyl-ACP methyl ester carboxylesterase